MTVAIDRIPLQVAESLVAEALAISSFDFLRESSWLEDTAQPRRPTAETDDQCRPGNPGIVAISLPVSPRVL